MPTTCGSYALTNAYATVNCLLVERLLSAGLIVIAKANLTELCGIKGTLPLGWSALGGQSQSPYVIGGIVPDNDPCGNSTIAGSSSGSAASVAAGFAPLSIAQETTGQCHQSVSLPRSLRSLIKIKYHNRLVEYTCKPRRFVLSQVGCIEGADAGCFVSQSRTR